MSRSTPNPGRIAELQSALSTRILVLDGAMGTMIQSHGLTEEDFKGEAYRDHPGTLLGANDLLSAIFMNQGQMCTAGSRLLVEESIYDKFVNELVKRTKQLTIGPASDATTQFGPLINREHRDDVLRAINDAVKAGATLVCGGKIPDNEEFKSGFYLH